MRKSVKFALIAVIMALSLLMGACGESGQRSSAPKVEIVERSQLLNQVGIESFISAENLQYLSENGLTVTFRDFTLTSDTQAEFNLILANTDGKKVTLPMHAMLDYNHSVENGKDVFADIRLYWGGIDLYGDDIVVVNISQPVRFSLTDMEMKWDSYDTAFADGGYILDMVRSGENTAFLYYTANDEGIAVFDDDNSLVSRISFAKEAGTTNLADTTADDFIPGALQATASLHDTGGGTLYAAGKSHSYLFDYTTQKLYTFGDKPWRSVVRDSAVYNIHRLENPSSTINPFVYILMAESKGEIIDRQTFSIPVSTIHQELNMFINGNGQPVLMCASTGMVVTVDLVNDTTYTQFNITDEMLGEKLYTSMDKAYELYSYAHFESDVPAYHIAMKETETGDIRYIGEIGKINGYYEGETGFMPDNTVYLLTSDDCRLFSNDMTSVSHIFSLSDTFPLGVVNNNYDTRHLVSVAVIDDERFAAVYYEDNLMASDAERFVDIENKNILASVYRVAVFDKDGNMKTDYSTDMNVVCGWCPVNSHVKGGQLSIAVNYKDTDQVLTKGTLDLSDGSFIIVKEYSEPVR
ncbi:MAG: hypothetical protein IKU54_06935 [Oscillospiraceae bacterium]|nr:hypothetical protein [Oscillospiraceae bacterium]